jgi:hypothetical protein
LFKLEASVGPCVHTDPGLVSGPLQSLSGEPTVTFKDLRGETLSTTNAASADAYNQTLAPTRSP